MTRYEREEWGIAPGRAAPGLRHRARQDRHPDLLRCRVPPARPRHGRGRGGDPAGAELHRDHARLLAGPGRRRWRARWRTSASWCTRPTVGPADWLPVAEQNHGAAAIYGPPDTGFPEDGVIAIGKPDVAGWVHGEVSLEAVRQARADGMVLTFRDWAEQPVTRSRRGARRSTLGSGTVSELPEAARPTSLRPAARNLEQRLQRLRPARVALGGLAETRRLMVRQQRSPESRRSPSSTASTRSTTQGARRGRGRCPGGRAAAARTPPASGPASRAPRPPAAGPRRVSRAKARRTVASKSCRPSGRASAAPALAPRANLARRAPPDHRCASIQRFWQRVPERQ